MNQDGQIDELELDNLFHLKAGLEGGPMQGDGNESYAPDEQLGNYIVGGYNTYNKQPLNVGEML